MASRSPDKNSRHLHTPNGPILNLGVIAREVIVEWLGERGLGPTSREAAERLRMAPTTLNQIVKGERRMTVEKLSFPVSAISAGDPAAFFERHEALRRDTRSREEAELRVLMSSFPTEELERLLRSLAELKRLGPEVWESYTAVVDAILNAAKARR